MSHLAVMTKEVLHFLAPKDGGVYVDSSFGGGGHTRAMLESADCSVFALDKDPDAVERSRALQEIYPTRLKVVQGCFSQLAQHLTQHALINVDGVLFDAGVSSFQLDEAERGFSFNKEGALDMRMDNHSGKTAEDYVNELSQTELAQIFKTYGEEQFAKPIAAAIIKARAESRITTTTELANIIAAVRPLYQKGKKEKRHPATRSFQALRIVVNEELEELKQGLEASVKVLSDHGRLVVITFHSLEDRIVKRFFHQRSGRGGAGVSRFLPLPPKAPPPPLLHLLTKSPITASAQETGENPRARSGKLRAAVRVARQ